MAELDDLGALTLGSRLRRITEHLYAAADETYKHFGFDFQASWFPVIQLLKRYEVLSVSELAEKAEQTHASISQITKQLEQKQYIEKKASPEDRRRQQIKLSSKGIQVYPQLKPLWEDMIAVLEGYLSQYQLIPALADFESQLKSEQFYRAIEDRRENMIKTTLDIIDYKTEYAEIFRTLNEEWLEKYFYIEDADVKSLSNPQKSIIDKGGDILFASYQGRIIGTCALVHQGEGRYELAKMAVTEQSQGLGAGRKLALKIIECFETKQGSLLYLETNNRLVPALALYQSLGFIHAENPTPSVYQRANVYMEWRAKGSEKFDI